MTKIRFTKNRKKTYFLENRKIQPHSLFKGTTAGDGPSMRRRRSPPRPPPRRSSGR